MKSKNVQNTESRLPRTLALLVLCIFALLPFHTFFTTWLGANFGYIDGFRIWKEVLIVGLLLGCILLISRDQKLQQRAKRSLLLQIVLLYGLFTLLRAGYGYASGSVNLEATIYGVGINLRYPLFMVITWTVAQKSSLLERYWLPVLVGPATIVILYGLLQQFVLDKNFLTHFGYGTSTVVPYQAVDLKPDYIRAQSTLRGPNPLGAYLVSIITICIAAAYTDKLRRIMYVVVSIAAGTLLVFTYSRSAWIGLVASLLVLSALLIHNPKTRRKLLLGATIGALLLSVGVLLARNNDTVQNAVFHTDETSQSGQSSNAARTDALTNNLKDAWQHPLGMGPGSAGPASFRNDSGAKIAENYYIQIAQEVGFIGLGLYLLLSLVVVRELWIRRSNAMSAVLLALFAGITAINMVSHAWADDTLSLIWWGLAGIAISVPARKSAILNANTHEKPKPKKAQSRN